MADNTGMSIDEFRTLTARAGMALDTAELEHLKPMYEFFADPLARMHALDLEAEDLAVVFNPNPPTNLGNKS